MKNKIFLILAAGLPFVGHTQITIKAAEDINAGQTYNYQVCDSTGVRQGLTGPNQTWDFSKLVKGSTSNVSIVSADQAPNVSQFPGTNLAQKYPDGGCLYLSKQPAMTYVTGYAGNGVTVQYPKPMAFIKRPVSFGGTNSFPYTDRFIMNNNKYSGVGMATIAADGYGTLILPDKKKYTNVLRVKIIQKEKDTVLQNKTIITMTATSYLWFDDKHAEPLLMISYRKSPIYNDQSAEYLITTDGK